MLETSPTLPSCAHLCLCNFAKQNAENQRLLAYRAQPTLVDRAIDPRFEMSGQCKSHKRFEAPYNVPRVSDPATMQLSGERPKRPSVPASSRAHVDNTTVQSQFAELTDAESQLTGYCRSSTFNFEGRSSYNPQHQGPLVGTTGRVPIRGTRPHYARPATKGVHPVGPNTAESVPTVPTNVPLPPVQTETQQACTNCTPRFDVYTACDGNECPMGLGSAQSRPPSMKGAPSCPDHSTTPYLAEQGQWWHWKGRLPEERKECWRWNDHPYELNAYGVARKANCTVQGSCCQDLFANNTKRKLLTKT